MQSRVLSSRVYRHSTIFTVVLIQTICFVVYVRAANTTAGKGKEVNGLTQNTSEQIPFSPTVKAFTYMYGFIAIGAFLLSACLNPYLESTEIIIFNIIRYTSHAISCYMLWDTTWSLTETWKGDYGVDSLSDAIVSFMIVTMQSIGLFIKCKMSWTPIFFAAMGIGVTTLAVFGLTLFGIIPSSVCIQILCGTMCISSFFRYFLICKFHFWKPECEWRAATFFVHYMEFIAATCAFIILCIVAMHRGDGESFITNYPRLVWSLTIILCIPFFIIKYFWPLYEKYKPVKFYKEAEGYYFEGELEQCKTKLDAVFACNVDCVQSKTLYEIIAKLKIQLEAAQVMAEGDKTEAIRLFLECITIMIEKPSAFIKRQIYNHVASLEDSLGNTVNAKRFRKQAKLNFKMYLNWKYPDRHMKLTGWTMSYVQRYLYNGNGTTSVVLQQVRTPEFRYQPSSSSSSSSDDD